MRLAYLVSHPIQYQAPLLRQLASCDDVELDVYFMHGDSLTQYHDKEFAATIEWDVPLLDGYRSHFLKTKTNNVLLHAIRKGQVDVLWVHGYANVYYLWIMWIARLHGVRVMVRSETTDAFKDKSILKRCVRPIFFTFLRRVANGFLAIGTLNRQFFQRRSIPLQAIFSVPYAVDNQFFQQRAAAAQANLMSLRQELGLTDNHFCILFASKFMPRKHAADLIDAYYALTQDTSIKQPLALILIGEGEERVQLEARVRDYRLDNVFFLGFVNQSQLPVYYQLCDVFVLPSVRENWGLVINEVMNAAKPVIVSDQVGCAVDLVRHGENGFIYPARDTNALSTCLRELCLRNVAQRKAMGARSLARINEWGIEQAVSGIRHACRQLISSDNVLTCDRHSDPS